METHTSTAFRIRFRRRSWATGRIKASDIYPSLRRAIAQAHKLNNATRRFQLSPIEELYIERGVIMWSTDRIEVEDFEAIEAASAPNVLDTLDADFETWAPELQTTRRAMIAVGGYDENVTLAEVIRFQQAMEEA